MQTVTRLYDSFRPHHYDIHWDLTRAKTERVISGQVVISGIQLDPHAVRLHSHDLDIQHAYIDDKEITNFALDRELDELVLPHLSHHGPVTIRVDFSLVMTDAMHGLYPCYFVHDGKKQELYATQFESHHAREAFPCIDEPEAKATFRVSLTHERHEIALGNMPVSLQEARDKSTLTTFDTTPVMSTYLVAFVVGDMQRATTRTTGGVEVNVYATKAHPHQSLKFALDHAARTIDFFDDYFGVPYPLPKSDHVALPDFASGAMENWGLITYREVALLADPKTSGISSRQYIAEVVAHELSHQWFGNLVTMKWWDNLWLNESFANMMEYLAPNALYPEWDLWRDFATEEGVMALRRDAIDGVQPVELTVNHPDEITSIFDGAIVYAKGGRLLRMMQTWIGDEAFRKGLKAYFTAHQYGNTTGDDLWGALSAASGKDVSGLMHAWIKQPGYPVVHASLVNGHLFLRQEQFFVGPHEESHTLWPVPLRANITGLPEILDERERHIPCDESGMIFLNWENNGHYIVNYDEELRQRIISALKDGRLTDTARAQFLNDQVMLARGGYINSAVLIHILDLYRNETDEKVWSTVALAISDLKKFVDGDEQAELQLKSFISGIARANYTRLGIVARSKESDDDAKLRATILGCMVYSDDKQVAHTISDVYDQTPIDELDPELRGIILSSVVKQRGDDTLVHSLLALYRSTSSSELKNDLQSGITSTRQPAITSHILDLLEDGDTVRKQDLLHWYVGLLANKYSRDASWKWMRDEWSWIEQAFDGDKSYDYFPRYSASLLASRTQLQEYIEFFTPLRDNPALTRTIDMGIRDLEGRIALVERDRAAVIGALLDL